MTRSILDLALCDDPDCHACRAIRRHDVVVHRRAERTPVAPLGGTAWAVGLVVLGLVCAGVELWAQYA